MTFWAHFFRLEGEWKVAIILYTLFITFWKVTGAVSHGIAILCTSFRLVYRGWTRHLWWEDAWAAFALISDVVCLVWIWTHTSSSCEYLTSHSKIYLTFTSVPVWTFAVAFTSVVWAARMSIVFSIIRLANFPGCKYHKWITYLIAVSFACMWVALIVQKVDTCVFVCQTTESVALSQMITDVIADVSLIAAPLQFWKNVGLSRKSKILILSAFGASLLITIIAIPHSIMLFQSATETTLIMAHVKAALSLVICNLLVIVTLAYRVRWKETLDPDLTFGSPVVFSSVIAAQSRGNAISMFSHSAQENTTQDR
ncbi:hypothetical protein EDB19DRAFT_1644112 [Suillus lakei]|nr:hypothetical protein EDB19DRAFT_1644112 [Suillus lakei]